MTTSQQIVLISVGLAAALAAHVALARQLAQTTRKPQDPDERLAGGPETRKEGEP
ncbi:MAG: hypothetical protein BWY59_00713 [Verrucomicrobia bacterium ADurb.Bin345]|nr:MAG: hypothetical protein BWY59_00713 [Verrucomicrobia bacterium ADurb.Bin345]